MLFLPFIRHLVTDPLQFTHRGPHVKDTCKQLPV